MNDPKNKRQWLRIDQKIAAEVTLITSVKSGSPACVEGVWIKDVSISGLGLVMSTQCDVGTKIKIKFQLPIQKQVIEAIGLVVWSQQVGSASKKQYRAGITFGNIQPADRAAILDFVHADGNYIPIPRATGGG